MLDDDLADPYKRAAETKKRRTRTALLTAARQVMRVSGMETKIEAIAAAGGVTTPTFYNFYKSRNALCLDAFTELVVPEAAVHADMKVTLAGRIESVSRDYCQDSKLLRSALLGRLEREPERSGLPRVRVADGYALDGTRIVQLSAGADFVDHTAKLLADKQVLSPANDCQSSELALSSAALLIVDHASRGEMPDKQVLAHAILAACRGRQAAGAEDQAGQIIADARKTADLLISKAQATGEHHIREVQERAAQAAQHLAQAAQSLGTPLPALDSPKRSGNPLYPLTEAFPVLREEDQDIRGRGER